LIQNTCRTYDEPRSTGQNHCAEVLAQAGLKPGNRVAAWLSTQVETVVFLLACSLNGYVFCPSLHRNHAAGEVRELLERMRASAFVGEEGYGAHAGTANIFGMIGGIETLRKVYRLRPVETGAARRTATSYAAQVADIAGRTDADSIVYLAFGECRRLQVVWIRPPSKFASRTPFIRTLVASSS
jgi:acyl-coenzyme A synthetase/AMP-(fatty) acid ligase